MGRVIDEMLEYSLKKPTLDNRTEQYLTPSELLDRLVRTWVQGFQAAGRQEVTWNGLGR